MTLTAASLRSRLTTALGSAIGQYQFANSGGTAPAMAVLPDPTLGDSYPPSGTKVIGTGLEVVILAPSLSINGLLDGHELREDYFVFLKAWSKTATTIEATKLVLAVLPEAYQVIRTPASEVLSLVEATRIVLREYSHLRSA